MKFDWGYMRRGWVSCKKAGQALNDHQSELAVLIDAKKETIKGDGAWELVSAAEKIYIASGKKILEFAPTTENKDAIMKKMLGRTGNLRAPAIRRGSIFFIGFNEQMYSQELFT